MGEEIAEKVVDALFEQGTKAASTISQVVPKAIYGLGNLGAVTLSQVKDEFEKNKQLKEMLGLEGEISDHEMREIIHKFSQKAFTVEVGDADVKEYEAFLKDMGVLYAKIDRKDDDCKIFTYLERDREKVFKATELLKASRGQVTEINSDLYFNSLSPDNVHVIQGLSSVEVELFRYYARQQGLLFTVVETKDETMVVCDRDDAKKARRAMLYTGWALTGADGARVREQVEHRLAGRTAIRIAAEEAERELYIVSGINPSNYVKISAEDYAQYKDNKQVSTASRADPDFFARCMAASDGLVHPVVLSANQFREGMTAQELQNAHTTDMFPSNYDDVIEMEHVNRFVNLVSMKAGLDDEHNATWGLTDPSVSYADFASYEYISDAEEREARAYEFEHFKAAAFYSHDHHAVHDVEMESKDLDYIIAKAEDKRRRMFATEGTPKHEYNFGTRSEPSWQQREERI